MRSFLLSSLLALASAHKAGHGADEAAEMGPISLLWPPDRTWDADHDNTPPCGSKAGPGDRTEFPLMNGAISLVMREAAWDVAIRISYKDDPTKQSDFQTLISNATKLEDGHMCYPMPKLAQDIEAGSNATIQLEYFSEDDGSKTDTFFACSDIVFVANSKFGSVPNCFNVTSDAFETQDEVKMKTDTPLKKDNGNSSNDGSRTGLAAFWVGIAGIFVTLCIL